MSRLFLLSPVRLDGARGRALLEQRSRTEVAQALETTAGAPIGEVFQYVSGLYFRGKLAYARRFARPPANVPWLGDGVLVITSNRGLVPAATRITRAHLEAFAETPISENVPAFTQALTRDAARLRDALVATDEVVLLGSLATQKYLAPLVGVLGRQLVVPTALRGRGDMARGAMLLRAATAGQELVYATP
jgi:hypothetical protein